MQYPKRPATHVLEQQSETFFRQHLPQGWTVSKPEKDYGHDLAVEIREGEHMKGLDLIVQLKSSLESNQQNNYERIQLATSTYNYLWDNLRVVLLVKYVQSENESYWILLKDVEAPENEDQESFTVYIPRTNRISTIDWENNIVAYVRDITLKKITAVRLKKYRH